MTAPTYGSCDLHIPYKKWSGDQKEEDNYAEMERWAQRLKDCRSAPTGGPSIIPKQIHRCMFYGMIDIPIGLGNGANVPFSGLKRSGQINDNFSAFSNGVQINSTGFLVWYGNIHCVQNTFVAHVDIYTNVVQHRARNWRNAETSNGGLTMQSAQPLSYGGGMWVDGGEVISIFIEHVGDPP